VPTQFLIALVTLAAVLVLVALVVRTDRELAAAAVAGGFLLLLLSVRWPLVSLFLLVSLIPIEQALVIDESFGTLSRYVAILFIVSYAGPRLARFRLGVMPVSAWGYVIWALLSVGWAIAPDTASAEVPVLILLFATAACVAALIADNPRAVRPLLWTYSLAAGGTALLAIYTFATVGVTPGDRVAALDNQNPGYFAAILLPAFIFTVHELLNWRVLALSAALCTVCALGIVIAGARGTWLSALVVLVLFVLPRLDPIRRIAALGVVLLAFVLLLQVPAVAALVSDRTESAISSGGAGRTDIWSVAFTIYESSPVLGVGLQNFPGSFTPERVRQTDVSGSFYDPYDPARAQYRAAHNVVLQTLVELGPMGLILLTAFIGQLILRRGWGPDGAVVQAALAALALNALFLDMLNRRQLWLLIGMACGLAYLAHQAARASADGVPEGGRALAAGLDAGGW
jgi:O-antigen ligase